MPWTFAHPAAILPLLRHPRLSPAGLVIGSIAPDLGYYLGLFRLATWAHEGWGVLLICVPTGWAVHALWRRAWRPLADVLPSRLRAPWLAHPPRPVGAWALGASLALGAATHALWDAFTHAGGFFVRHVQALQAPLAAGLSGAQVMQQVSTALGASALAVVLWRQGRAAGTAAPPAAGEDARRWRDLAVLVMLALVVAWGFVGAPWRAHFHFVLVATDGVVLGALALAAWRARALRR